MKIQKGVQIWLNSSCNLGVGGGGLSTPRTGGFTPGKKAGALCTGDWLGPGAENIAPQEYDPRTIQPAARRCTN
jgi:hypothetical protein